MLESFVFSQIERETDISVIFRHIGAPAHCSLGICRALSDTFLNRWIGRVSPVIWSPCVTLFHVGQSCVLKHRLFRKDSGFKPLRERIIVTVTREMSRR